MFIRCAFFLGRVKIEAAMASEVRHRSRDVTKGLLEMFEGTVFHTVFNAAQYELAVA